MDIGETLVRRAADGSEVGQGPRRQRHSHGIYDGRQVNDLLNNGPLEGRQVPKSGGAHEKSVPKPRGRIKAEAANLSGAAAERLFHSPHGCSEPSKSLDRLFQQPVDLY